MNIAAALMSLFEDRLNAAKSLLAPAHDRELVLAIGALFFLFPLSKTVYVLALVLAIVFSVRQANPTPWWDLIRATPLLWFPIAIYLLVLLQAPTSPADTSDVLEHLRKYARLLFLVFFFLVFVGQERRQQVALQGFTAAMVLIVVVTWIRIVWSSPLLGSQTDGSAFFGDHITQNIMVAFFTLIAFQNARKSKTRPMRIVWGALLLLSVLSITHYSIGRTGQILLLAVWISYVAFMLRGIKLMMACAFIASLSWISYNSSDHLKSRFEQAVSEARSADTDRLTSIAHRLYNYQTTPRMIAEKPIFGHGTGAYHTQICRFIDHPEQCSNFQRHPHNQFLFFAAEHGLIGCAFYIAFVLGLFVCAFRSGARPAARVMLFAFAVMLFINSFINSPLFSSRESQFFALMAALLIAMNHPTSGGKTAGETAHG
ncbi:MAG: O-antigen ligase family protein [Betaproteobacteria bacterium]|nr:O-antigen ligase family protein [Betaproteobacteria bacterium]